MKKVLLNIFLFFSFSILQSYSFLNQRSHSELDWKFIESQNIKIIFHDPFYEEAKEALAVGEESFKKLSKSYDYYPQQKIKIYISDQDDIVNGYSFLNDHIAIWINQNDYLKIFTGKEKWLRKVISHEMSHHFVAMSISSWIDNFVPYYALEFPSDFNEGYAMFFSGEKWGYSREDSKLRKGIFGDDLSQKTTSGYNYTIGFSQVRYLHAFYGEEKLRKLLKYRNRFKIYNFEDSFESVYNKKYADFVKEWKRYIKTYYFGKAYNLSKQSANLAEDNSSLNSLKNCKTSWHRLTKVIIKENKILTVGYRNKNQKYQELVWGVLNEDSLKLKKLHVDQEKNLIKANSFLNPNLSQDGTKAVFVRYNRKENGSLRKIVYKTDCETERTTEVSRGNYPVVTNKGIVYFQQLFRDSNRIKVYSADNKLETLTAFSKKTQICDLTLNPTQNILAWSRFGADSRFYLDIYDLSKSKISSSIHFKTIPTSQFWISSDELIFSLEGKDFLKEIYLINIKSKMIQKFQEPAYNFYPVWAKYESDTLKALGFADLERKNNPLGFLKLTANQNTVKDSLETNFYTKWLTTKYHNPISDNPPEVKIQAQGQYSSLKNISMLTFLPLPINTGLYFATVFNEPLGKHFFTNMSYVPYNYDADKAWYLNTYTNNQFYPKISLEYNHYIWTSGISASKIYYQNIDNLKCYFDFPVNFINRPFWDLEYAIGADYKEIENNGDQQSSGISFDEDANLAFFGKVNLEFDLPYLNSKIHPMQNFRFQYKLAGANDQILTNYNYLQHDFKTKIGFAPFYKSHGFEYLTLVNSSRYYFVNGYSPIQEKPTTDKFQNIPVEGLINNRIYIRGYDKSVNGEKLLLSSSEIWIKAAEQQLNNPLLFPESITPVYFGLGGFIDYSQIEGNSFKQTFKSYGYEVKAVVSVLGFPIINRVGQAFELKTGEDLGVYYQAKFIMELEP